MSGSAVRHWARARTIPEWAILAAAIAVFGYVGWDSALWDARLQLLLHLIAVAAVIGLGVAAVRGVPLPRTPLDTPILGLLAAFALATASAMNHGMSLRAMGAIVAFALGLPIALLAVRHRPSWVGVVTAVPVLFFSVPSLAVLLSRRLDWVLAGAPGLPPLRLPGEGTPFGSVAVPPFVIWPAWALAGLIEAPAWRRAIRIGLVAVGVPLTILSGSRSAWLAIAAAAVVGGLPWAWGQRHRLRLRGASAGRTLLLAAVGLAAVAVVAALVVPRLTAVTSLLYRVALWRDTLAAWQTDPLLGIGPGFMPYARQAAAADFTFPVRQPHSHNLPLGVLGDAGIVGLAAGLVLVAVAAWVAGPWRSRSATGRAAAIVLIGVAVGGLFEDLTFLPNFNLLVIALLAVAVADAGAVRWSVAPPPGSPRGRLAGTGAATIGLVLLASMVTADAGAVAYRLGEDAARDQQWAVATERFERSATIDPWHPATPKALAITAAADGRLELARRAAAGAVARNPGDGPSWTNLHLVCAQLGDPDCREEALERAVAMAPFGTPDLANAALGYEALGLQREADDAVRRSLLAARLTALALDWPRIVEVGDSELAEDFGALTEMNRLLASHVNGEPVDPERITDPATRAVAHALAGDRPAAEASLEAAMAADPDQPVTWEIAVVLHAHWDEPIDELVRIGEAVRGGPFPGRDQVTLIPSLTYDIASFRGVPLDGLLTGAERLRTAPPFPWILERLLP
jgi:O-antigen ligase/tetratricopeptide (TPR) repeat protein